MRFIHLYLALLVFSLSLSAQNKSDDVALITATVENYFDGYVQRDAALLYTAFDAKNGAMKVLITSEDGNETVENDPFKERIPKWASGEERPPEVLENSSLHILNIDVVEGKIASVKIRMKVGETTYIDILSLHKINRQWRITNKMFVVDGAN